MAEHYRFFDSTSDDERVYTADEFAEYFRRVLSDGIFNGGTNLKVESSGTDIRTYIQPGYAWVQGYMYKVDTGPLYLQHEYPDPNLDRIDRVVIRLDKRLEHRYVRTFILKGTPAASPVPPVLTRDENVFELSLAQVRIIKGKSYIEGSQITDERLNNSVCGLVNSLIQVDTQTMFDQFKKQWDGWMATIEGKTPVMSVNGKSGAVVLLPKDIGAVRAATRVIAANNSSQKAKEAADYVVPDGAYATDTIQTAVNSLPSSGGKVILLEGTYIMDSSRYIPDNTTIEGMGAGTILKAKTGLTEFVRMLNLNSNSVIQNLTIDGSEPGVTSRYVKGISISGNQNIIEGLLIKNCGFGAIELYGNENKIINNITMNSEGHGIYLTSNSEQNIVTGNKCSNCISGIYSAGKRHIFIGNIVQGNKSNGIHANTIGTNVIISGNICLGNAEDGIVCDASNSIVEGNLCIDNTNRGIYVTSAYSTVQGNTVRKSSLTSGIGLRVEGTGNFVTNNDLYNSGQTKFSDGGSGTIVTAGNRV
ncbi:right-handed parallel beta-helix repeat-containing protein [Brevibacillus sp. NRS-1366]|uniref:right-handed parallel beta-helix repeat-containing protein n=1 Tax=Brevibacillus sp. NRS-1366 TaxID=3233899 RepID=UPI003D1C4FD3